MNFFPDHTTFLKIGMIEIKWYAILILSGALIVYSIMSRNLKENGYEQDDADNIFIGSLLFGVLGARIWYVLFSDLAAYLADPVSIFEVWNGGLGIHGGLIAGTLFAFFYAKRHKMDFVRLVDAVLPYVLIAQAVGRWGNFINQEAYGKAVTEAYFAHWPGFLSFVKEAMYIDGSYWEPMFFYESCLCVIGFILIMVYKKYSHPKRGDLGSCYLLWYGAIRFWIEQERSDSLMFLGLKMAQIISVIFMAVGLLGLMGVWRKILKKKKPVILFDNDGTIVDTEGIVKASFRAVFKEFLPEKELTKEELDSFLGPTLHDSFARYFPEDKVDLMIARYREDNAARLAGVKPMPGAKELIEELKAAGYLLGIVSAKQHETVQKGLEYSGLAGDFAVIIGPEDYQRPKPDKDGLITACKKLGVSHDDLIYVGDAVTDIQAAKRAGAYSVGYSADAGRLAQLSAVKPNRVIKDLSEIKDILKEDISWTAQLR